MQVNQNKINEEFNQSEFSAKRPNANGSRADESMNRTAESYIAKHHSSPYKAATPIQRQAVKSTVTIPKPIERKISSSQKTANTNNTGKTVAFSSSDALDYAGFNRRKPKSSKYASTKTVLRRTLIVIASVLLFAIITVYSVCFTIAKGPSETVRNLLVLSAKQASATKWVPALFLDKETVESILSDSEKISTDIVSLDEYMTESNSDGSEIDEWANAKDGMIYKKLKGSTYTAYMLIVKDPSRIFVGTSSDNFSGSTAGATIFDAAAKNGAVAAINGGEFPDSGGIGTGAHPIGLTYSKGNCVWNDSLKRTFIGFDKDNKLVVAEPMTKAEADELGIRDAVSFQTGNVLISSDGESVTFYYADGNNGTAQRTAIGQRADGAVILLVTDGRTASSLGATHNDVIDIMVQYGAINAAMLDGGSSAMMYYNDYYNKYDFDYDSLDQYQKKGLINKYKAFTTPRKMPTFFMVAEEEGANDNAY